MIMDEEGHRRSVSRKPISRKSMMRYLTRFKLKKKQHRIQPRTYLNSRGLCTRRLNPTAPVGIEKPIISNNVKARLESDLQYLLQNQNMIETRVKQPESYISLLDDKLNPAVESSRSGNKVIKDRVTISESAFHSKDEVNEMRMTQSCGVDLLQKSQRVHSSKSVTFQNDGGNSFDFDTVENQIRVGYGSEAPSLTGVPSDFFHGSVNRGQFEQFGYSFDEPNYTEPSSISSNRVHSQRNSFGKQFEGHSSPSLSLDDFDPKPVEKCIVRKTRIIKSTISRLGESPFLERTIIQKVKHSY